MADLTKKTIFPNLEGDKNPMETIKGPGSTYFTGIDDLINHKFTDLVTGYAYIYWVRVPEWFEKDDDLKYFKAFTQKNFRGFQGLTDITLNTSTAQSGFAGNEYDIVTGISRGNTEFTIDHREYSGSPMTKMYEKWIEGIRDSRTGIATYPAKYGVEYSAFNHTGELLYIVVRPDANNSGADIIEKAVYYSNVMPKTIPNGHWNYSLGSQETVQISIPFSGVPEMNPYVTEYARKVLKDHILKYDSDEDGIWVPVTNYGMDEKTKDIRAGIADGTRLHEIMNMGESE